MHVVESFTKKLLKACQKKKSIAVCVVFSLILPNAFTAESSLGLELTALDHYVREPDSNYSYKVINTLYGDGYKTFILEMTSQQWLTAEQVNFPIWEHYMVIVAPDKLLSDIGFLTIAGGSRTNKAPSSAPKTDIKRALETGTAVSTLFMVPNQPLVFSNDNGLQRTEDSVIAYTWDKYLRTGDEKWPLRLPMTKAAVRAMDTISDLLLSDEGGKRLVDKFVVAGGSKRGWTTWTSAIVDSRVIAIMPIVIDMLNAVSYTHLTLPTNREV